MTQTKDLILDMITKSENPQSDVLMARLDEYRGPLIVTETLRQLGIENTYIAGYFKEGAYLLENITTPANSRMDVTTNPDAYNQVTPSDFGTILEDLYHCSERREARSGSRFSFINQPILEGQPPSAVLIRSRIVSKEQHGNKEAKKKPLLTPKEKKAAKQAKKHAHDAPVFLPNQQAPGH